MSGVYIKEETRNETTKQLELKMMRDKLGVDECGTCSDDYHHRIDAYSTRFHSSSEQVTVKVPVFYCPVCGRKLT